MLKKLLLTLVTAGLLSSPAFAAKPATSQYLAGGPIPTNTGTEVFSCNVINHGAEVIFDFNIKLCSVATGSLDCSVDVTQTLGGAATVQGIASGIMMVCKITYEGQPGDVTGTACMSDVGQSCVPLQEVEPKFRILN